MDIEGLLNYIAEESRHGQVVVMVSGDPGFYSLLPALRRRFPRERLQVIPGISSVQLAFARVAEPWQDANLLSFHGREIADEVLLYRPGRTLSFLTDRLHRPREIAARLLQLDWPEDDAVLAMRVLVICCRKSGTVNASESGAARRL